MKNIPWKYALPYFVFLLLFVTLLFVIAPKEIRRMEAILPDCVDAGEVSPPPNTPRPDFAALPDSSRSSDFINYMQPLVSHINADLLAKRIRLEKIAAQKKHCSADLAFVNRLIGTYHLAPITADSLFKEEASYQKLLRRVDVIPETLVVAQAAVESGWGTSRFARQGNAYFGQWCFSKGCGIPPKQPKSPGVAYHEIMSFPMPLGALEAYVLNLNTHRAYAKFRKLRAQLRKAHIAKYGEFNPFHPNPISLLKTLGSYSQRGGAYLCEVYAVMRDNHLIDPETLQTTNPPLCH